MLLSLGRGMSPANSRGLGLTNAAPSCILDLDITQPASFSPADQRWINLIPSPADGANRASYNALLGNDANAASNDPTPYGQPGMASTYFLLDGGDRFSSPDSLTPFIKALPKTTGGTALWFAIAFRYISNGLGQAFFSCKSTSTTAGITLVATSSDRLQFAQYGDSGVSATSSSSGPLLTNGTDYLVLGSRAANGTVTSLWANTRNKTDLAHSYNVCSSDSSSFMSLGASPGGGSAMAGGTRLYAFAMGGALLDNAAAARLFTLYNARHQRTYA